MSNSFLETNNPSVSAMTSEVTPQPQLKIKKKRLSDPNSSLKRYPKSPIPKVRKLGKSIDGYSSSYVGFRPSDFRSMQDLSHLRHIIESQPPSEKATSVLETLDTMIKSIPMDNYENSEPDEKFSTIQKLMQAYNFAWNEGTLQLKQISEEHATVFLKIKNFYIFLLEQYPQLLTEYQKQVSQLKRQCEAKDQEISTLKKEIETSKSGEIEIREFISGLRDEIYRIKDRKAFFKHELNHLTLQNEKIQQELTELRCKMAKEDIPNDKITLGDKDYNAQSSDFIIEKVPEKEYIDVDTNTDPLNFEVKSEPVTNFHNDSKIIPHNFSTFESFESAITVEQHSALRHVIYNFMISEVKTVEPKFSIDNNAQMKKFYWIFPKIISLMISGIQFEDPSHPFTTFEELLLCFLTHHYQTSYLIQQVYSSIVLSAQLLDGLSPVIHLFNKFAKCEYDFFVFRFFHTVLEFSICYTTPDISSLVSNEGITPEESVIIISREKARSVFSACFPFKEIPSCLNDGPNNKDTSYWSFMTLLIEEFISCRSHFWAVLKNALLLADCPDNTSINYGQFASFMGIIFPGVRPNYIKSKWKELTVRDAASFSKKNDVLQFSSLTFLCVSKDESISNVMSVATDKNFARLFYEFSSPMLDLLAFVVNRLTYFIPSISSQVPKIQSEFEYQSFKIRDSLFMCDIPTALAHYRLLLHRLDYITVKDLTSISLPKNISDEEAERLIDHMKLREKVAGISSSK